MIVVVGDSYNDMVMFGEVYGGILFYLLENVICEFLQYFVVFNYDDLCGEIDKVFVWVV